MFLLGLFVDEEGAVEDSDAVYNTLDAMQNFWSNLEVPVDNVLTTYAFILHILFRLQSFI